MGEALQELRGNGVEVGAAELAHHFLLAAIDTGGGVVPDAETALRYCIEAAVEARGRFAYEDLQTTTAAPWTALAALGC